MKENNYNIYWMLDPRKPGRYSYPGLEFSFLFEPFYIGKSFRIDKRLQEHIDESYSNKKIFNRLKSGKIRKIKNSLNLKPYFVITNEKIDDKESNILEKKFIKIVGRFNLKNGPLTNLTEGGDGGKGIRWTEKQKNNLIGKRNGEMNGNFGNRGSFNNISKEYLLLSPDGLLVHVKGLNDWLKTNGFNPNRIQRLMVKNKEQRKSYKGWRICKVGDKCDLCEKEELSKTKKDKQSLTHKKYDYKIISPNGEIFYHHSLNDFCVNHKLATTNMNKVVRGLIFHAKGWTGYIIGQEYLRDDIEYKFRNFRLIQLKDRIKLVNKEIS